MKNRSKPVWLLTAAVCLVLAAGCEKAKDEGPVDYDVVVIGAGAGGLSSAATLAKNGLRVAVFEQHDKVGGFMTAFERGDYRFEVSLHVLANVVPGTAFYKVLDSLGVIDKVEFLRVDPMWRCVFPDRTFDVPGDREAFRSYLHREFPDSREGIDAFFDTAEKSYEEVVALGELSRKSLPVRVLNYLVFPLKFPTMFKYRNATLQEILDDHVSDARVQGILAQLWGYLGLPPSQAAGLYYTVMWHALHANGAFYPEGTSQAISNAMADTIRENGGQIFLDTRIDKILMEDGRAAGVVTQRGKEVSSRFVVSNASALQTYLRLVGEEHLAPSFVRKLKDMEISCSLVIVYLGLDLDLSQTDLRDQHEVFLNSGYDFDQDYRNLEAGNLDDPHIVMGLYSNIAPGFAPKGKSVISLVTVMPYEYMQNWRYDEDYDAYTRIKEEVARKLIRRVEDVLPGASDHIEVMEIGTPRTIERYTLHDKGAVYGFALRPDQSFNQRLQQSGPVDRLYLAGGWTFPGNGQSSCILSGFLAAQEILKQAHP